jgi:16S rRNA U516 pseudouridylate synthase RsuA-like enzyme
MERLQKILAHAGVASRREAEQWITDGRVAVNGTVVCELGTRADPLKDSIKVDGRRIKVAGKFLYFALHKPPGVTIPAQAGGKKSRLSRRQAGFQFLWTPPAHQRRRACPASHASALWG